MSSTKEQPDYVCISRDDSAAVLYISMALFIFGIVGNSTIMFVMFKYLSKCSSSIYIFILALSDSVYLVTYFMRKLLPDLKCLHLKDSKLDFVNHGDITCKFLTSLSVTFANYSSTIILCFAIERFIAVKFPTKFKQICTITRTRILCLSLFVVTSVLIAVPYWVIIGIQDRYRICGVKSTEFLNQYFNLSTFELIVFRVTPILGIIELNIFIIYKLCKKQRLEENQNESNDNHSGQMTRILFLICASFLVLYLPYIINSILWKILYFTNDRRWIYYVSSIAFKISFKLYLSRFSVHFYLYLLGSNLFRKRLGKTSCCAERFLNENLEVELTGQ